MPDKKISVDDILNELQLNRAKAEHKAPSGDMQRIDEVIREILTKKQEDQLKQQNRVLTEKEKATLEKEITAQTKTLTKQFEKLKRERERQKKLKTNSPPPSVPEESALPPSPALAEAGPPAETGGKEIQASPVRNGQQHEAAAKPETSEEKKDRYDDLKRIANSQHIRQQMLDITSHFGNFKMEDASVDEVYLKTEIKASDYKEYKNNRNKKVESFSLGGKGTDSETEAGEDDETKAPAELTDEMAEKQLEAEKKMQTRNFEYRYEYTTKSQADLVSEDLKGIRRSIKNTLIALGAIGLNAFLLSFIKIQNGAVFLLGKLAVTPLLYAAVNLILLLLSLAVSFSIFKNVIDRISKRNPTKDYFCLAAAIGCLAVNIIAVIKPAILLIPGVHLFTPIAVLILLMDFASKYQTISKTIENFKFVSSSDEKYAVVQVSDLKVAKNMTKGVIDSEPVLVKNVQTEFFTNFLSHSFKYDISDILSQKALLIALPAAVLLALLGFFLTKDWFISLSLFSGALAVGCGFLGMVIVSFPLFDTADIVNRFAGMMPGYDSIEEYKDTNSLLIDACDLFPAKSVVLHGIKTFQGKRIDDAIVDAASVICQAKSALQNVFLSIINNKTELLRPVDSIQYEDLMGISAWVSDRRVLIGNRDLMINHSVAVPKEDYEEKYRAEGCEVVYLSTGGELCAAFIVEFTTEKTIGDVIRLLDKNDMLAIVRTMDSCVTSEMLAAVFQTDPARFKILPSRLHPDYAEQIKPQPRLDSMLGNNGSLFGYIVSLAAAKKLHGCIRFGTILYGVSAVCGILLMAVMLLLGNPAGFGCMQALVFLAVFTFLYWIYEKNMHL